MKDIKGVNVARLNTYTAYLANCWPRPAVPHFAAAEQSGTKYGRISEQRLPYLKVNGSYNNNGLVHTDEGADLDNTFT